MADTKPQKALWTPSKSIADDSVNGLVAATPWLAQLGAAGDPLRVVVDVTRNPRNVAVVSGGGSGHEPAFAGFVGEGMLAAAVCGDVFASPSASAVFAAICAAAPSDVLIVVNNYTGDRVNFGLAVERARALRAAAAGGGGDSGAASPQLGRVELVVVGEDCAIESPGIAGRRGLAGCTYVLKVAGAMAAAGKPLEEVAAAARAAAAAIGTLGVALNVAVPPGAPPSARLAGDMIELGLGLHGEPGYEACEWAPLDALVPRMLARILEYNGGEGETNSFKARAPGAPLALLVNNLGGASNLEMGAVAHEALAWLEGQGHAVSHVHVGAPVTSCGMHGVSLTLMALDEALAAALDAPTAAPGWPRSGGRRVAAAKKVVPVPPAVGDELRRRDALLKGRPLASASPEGRAIDAAVRAAAAALQANVERLNRLDAAAGDGDTGSTVGAAATALARGPEGAFAGSPAEAMAAIAAAIEVSVGGSLGGLSRLGLVAASTSLERSAAKGEQGPAAWAAALSAAVDAVELYGRARPGDRTMLDALAPAARALAAAAAAGDGAAAAARAAADAAAKGAEATKGMAAAAGRASYLGAGGAALSDADPGATAAAVWLAAVADSLAAA